MGSGREPAASHSTWAGQARAAPATCHLLTHLVLQPSRQGLADAGDADIGGREDHVQGQSGGAQVTPGSCSHFISYSFVLSWLCTGSLLLVKLGPAPSLTLLNAISSVFICALCQLDMATM